MLGQCVLAILYQLTKNKGISACTITLILSVADLE